MIDLRNRKLRPLFIVITHLIMTLSLTCSRWFKSCNTHFPPASISMTLIAVSMGGEKGVSGISRGEMFG